MNRQIETQRLILRPLTEQDAQDVFEWVSDPGANHANANAASGRVLAKCGFVFDHYGQYSRYDGSETFEASFYTLYLS